MCIEKTRGMKKIVHIQLYKCGVDEKKMLKCDMRGRACSCTSVHVSKSIVVPLFTISIVPIDNDNATENVTPCTMFIYTCYLCIRYP